ncbi:MAG TPA: RHS repeat-associated core domain-containing protein [Bryobacteraceae bacterium]|nr:RHS repeat-associated core domain-containing protein [Bryobacteraceae bacterium]
MTAQIREAGDLIPPRGTAPTGLFGTSELDTVNLNTGAVALRIPITAFSTNRGGAAGFDLALAANSAHYDVRLDYSRQDQDGNPELTYNLEPSSNNNWRYSFEYSLEFEGRPNPVNTYNCGNSEEYYQSTHPNRMTLVLPDGSRHLLRLRLPTIDDSKDGYYRYDPLGTLAVGCGPAGNNLSGALTYYTTDGTYLSVAIATGQVDIAGQPVATKDLQWALYFPDGGVLHQVGMAPRSPFTLKDRNNNGISMFNAMTDGYPTHYISDDAGRTLTVQERDGEDWIITPGAGSAELKWIVHWRDAVGVSREYNCTASQFQRCTFQPAASVVDYIRLPQEYCDGGTGCTLQYQFAYNTDNNGGGLASISSVTTPLGAQTQFTFRLDNSTGYLYTYDEYLNDWVSTRRLTIPRDYASGAEETSYNFAGGSTVVAPDGGATTTWVDSSTEKRGLAWKVQYPDGSLVERYWAANPPSGVVNDSNNFNNPYIRAEYRTVAGRTSMKVYDYDLNGNATSVSEYDWFNAGTYQIPRNAMGIPNGIVGGLAPVRTTAMTYEFPSAPGQETNAYFTAAVQGYRAAVKSRQVAGAGVESRTEYVYTPVVSGHSLSLQATSEYHWDSTKSPTVPASLNATNAVRAEHMYDSNFGSLWRTKAPGSTSFTEYEYDSTWTFIRYKRIKDATGTVLMESFFDNHDAWTGLPQFVTPDTAHPTIRTQTLYDALGRAQTVQEAVGTPAERQTLTQYSLQQRRIVTQSSVYGPGSSQPSWRVTAQHFDGAGRPWRNRLLETGSVGEATASNATGMITDTEHRVWASGRSVAVSNPYRPTGDDPRGWKLTCLDRMGRVVDEYEVPAMEAPGCGSVGGYTAHSTVSYDQQQPLSNWLYDQTQDAAGKERRLVYDGLRRLRSVYEDPGQLNYRTEYSYDGRDNLIAVQQYGTAGTPQQSRTFGYDSLGRLRTATQPESGLLSYQYYDDGKLQSRLDGRSITTLYTYDGLDRPETVAYTGGVGSTVRYCYDGKVVDAGQCVTSATAMPLSHGRLTQVQNGEAATTYGAFDELGRVLKSEQKVGSGPAYGFEYNYNAMGLVWMKYPSGREVTTAYDAAGRPQSVAGSGVEYLKPVAGQNQYWALGALRHAVMGNGQVETWQYNTQRQPTELQVPGRLVISLSYSPNQNNGNVAGQTITVPGLGEFTQTYGYDRLNRLEMVNEGAGSGASGSWNASFGYGAFGNVWRASGSYSPDLGTPTQEQQYSSATNRLVQLSNGQSLPADTYDGAGNLQKEPWLTVAAAMSYDGENRLVSHTRGGTVVQYGYDGEGRRVRRVGPDGTTTYVYDALGQLAAEYGPTVESGCGEPRCYVTVDHLGSTRMLAGTTGIRRYDYRPYGEELYAGDGGRTTAMGYTAGRDQVTVKFTGKERDVETGLDYFGARYFSGAHGRFTSPDAPFADQDPADPQSWNLYAYGRNNPLLYTDPSGSYVCGANMSDEDCHGFEEARGRAVDAAERLRTRHGDSSQQYLDAQRAIDAYGEPGIDNGVTVTVGAAGKGAAANVDAGGNLGPSTADNPNGQNILVTLSRTQVARGGIDLASALTHEGSHVADASAWVTSGFAANPTLFATELRAYFVNLSVEGAFGVAPYKLGTGGGAVLVAPGFLNPGRLDKFVRTSPLYAPWVNLPAFDPQNMVRRR